MIIKCVDNVIVLTPSNSEIGIKEIDEAHNDAYSDLSIREFAMLLVNVENVTVHRITESKMYDALVWLLREDTDAYAVYEEAFSTKTFQKILRKRDTS